MKKNTGWFSQMPKYYDHKSWQNEYYIKTTPRPFLRSLPILKRIIPYHVGDKIEFDIIVKKLNNNGSNLSGRFFIYEKIIDKETKIIYDMNNECTRFITNHIPQEGAIFIGIGNENNPLAEAILFTTNVLDWDTVLNNWFWVLLAAFLGGISSLLIGVILGFIKIIPFWETWIP